MKIVLFAVVLCAMGFVFTENVHSQTVIALALRKCLDRVHFTGKHSGLLPDPIKPTRQASPR